MTGVEKAMDEQEWCGCTDPFQMLAFLGEKVSVRKCWLAACACCRRLPDYLASHAGRHCLEVVERFADGGATVEELRAADEDGWDIRWYRNWPGSSLHRAIIMHHEVQWGWGVLPASTTQEERKEAAARALADVADLLRELFGNPLRAMAIDPAWLAWNGGTARRIAQAIYNERRFEDLPILADALEEAGCTKGDLLGHCRQQGEHFLGCWALDLVLANE
jgi:hypothetical protein